MREAFPDPRTLLKRYGLTAKKSWGQNFLSSESVYRGIVDATVDKDDDWIVEVGAGLGTLTMRLAQRVPEGKVVAVERDRDMVTVLEAELGHLDNVEIHPSNAMTYDFESVAKWRGDPITVCGNLPYQIASQLLFRFMAARRSIGRIVVMLQKEMAERLVAAPDTSAYGAMGILISTWADIEMIVRAKAGAFVPPPKVDSAVVRITPLAEGRARAPIDDEDVYRGLVHAAFEQRRKVLRNAMRTRWPVEVIDSALEAAEIDGRRRGETLSIPEFAMLSNQLPPPGTTGA